MSRYTWHSRARCNGLSFAAALADDDDEDDDDNDADVIEGLWGWLWDPFGGSGVSLGGPMEGLGDSRGALGGRLASF